MKSELQGETTKIILHITIEQLNRLKAQAEPRQVSALIRNLIEEYLKEKEKRNER